MEYEMRTREVIVAPSGEPIYAESVTRVYIEDEAAGEFVVVEQENESAKSGACSIRIAPDEWPALRAAIGRLLRACRDGVDAA